MKPRYSLVATIVAAIPVVLLMINTANSGSQGSSPTVMPTSGMANGQVESVAGPDEAKVPLTATPEAVESLIAPEPDGTTLLQTYCSQCHSVKLLEKTKMSRSDWERTLSRMQRYSDLSNNTEKLLVLEHLAGSDKP